MPFDSARVVAATEPSTVARTGPDRVPARRRWRRAAVLVGLLIIGSLTWRLWLELNPEALRAAEAAYRRGDLTTALATATAYLQKRPWSGRAALIAARSLTRLDHAEQAEPYYGRAGRLELDDLHLRSLGLGLANLCEPAIRSYREILKRSPADVLALRRLAGMLIVQHRWDEALAVADRLVMIPSGVVIGHTLAGVVHHDNENPDGAAAEFEQVLALDPELRRMPLSPRLQFWIYLTRDLLTIGRAADAQRYLRRALEESDDVYLLDLLGQACWQQGDLDEAERWWRQSTERNDQRASPFLSLGRLALQRNRPEEAIPSLERAAKLAPGAREPVYHLSIAHRRLGHREEADRLRDQAKRLPDPSVPRRTGMGSLPSQQP